MVANEKLFKKEYASELFNIARSDLETAEAMIGLSKVRKENILFHIEQSVEKALKATLCHRSIAIPFTHDLYAVIQKFEPVLPPGGYALHDLTPYASIRRYEEGNFLISDTDMTQAVEAAKSVIKWAEKELKK